VGVGLIAGRLYGRAVLHPTAHGVELLASRAGRTPRVDAVPARGRLFLADLVKTLAGRAAIDPPSNLARSRVYIFTGGGDSLVSSETVEKGREVCGAIG
jgi:hypothetical protein